MRLFERVAFDWQGQTIVIPPEGRVRLIAQIEDVITLGELHGFVRRMTVPQAKLAAALAVVLQARGINASEDDVYDAMLAPGGADVQHLASHIVTTILSLMVPPKHMQQPAQGDAAEKPAAAVPPAAAVESSPPATG